MRRSMAGLAAATVVGAMTPMLGVVGAPAVAADGAGCITGWGAVSYTPAYSSKFNASVNCNGIWVLESMYYPVRVQGQYNDGTWKDSSYGPKWANPGTTDKKQIVGQTVDGRRIRGLAVDGIADYVRFKF